MGKNYNSSRLVNGLYVDSNGNVGINTTSTPERLSINGSIKIDTGTADGAQLVLASSGFSDWNIDNFSGRFRAYYGSTEYFTILANGRVGIGTSSPSYLLDVTPNNSTFAARIRNLNTSSDSAGLIVQGGVNAGNEVVLFRNAAGSDRMTVFANGNVVVNALGTGIVYSNSGVLTSTNPSDSRLKDNIEDIQYGLADILKLRAVKYNWKDDKINQGLQFGFIAQEVQEIMPEAIKEFGEDVKYLGLEKDAIYATLVKAIQELSAEVELLKNK